MPPDEELVRLAREGIERLNEKYQAQHPDVFFLCHRPRRWNAREGIWMGQERKRGKLMDFNALLRGDAGAFAPIVGDASQLASVRYVITLDTDTQLPRDAARQMIGAMAHILNRPVYDPRRRRVVAGYGVLQPRVGVSLPSARSSWFVRLFGGDAGLDPYTRVVSDIYQDLFAEGSFVGKGIYDVHVFETCCGAFPENAILSHDLLESAYVRSGLLTDVELFEDYPSRYPADVSRRHRWIRGDWQIAWWLFPWVPAGGSAGPAPPIPATALPPSFVRNPIAALSWWKIFDNLRRSLVPVAMLLLLVGAWLVSDPGVGISVTLFVLAVVGVVPLLSVLGELVRKPADLPLVAHLQNTAAALGKQGAQVLFALVFLPYEAYISVDAIGRTLARLLWSKKRLLEWKTFSEAHRSARLDLPGFFISMWIGPVLAVGVLVLAAYRPALWPVAGPLLALWLLSPVAAWGLSLPLGVAPDRLSDVQRLFLNKLARRTWRFFEVFVTAEENWLAPDNFQEHPAQVIASRTSPTNIGIALLANLAAYDFGFSAVGQFLERTAPNPGHAARASRNIAATATTGMRRARSSPWCRCMSRPSTAAISWAICWCSARGCWNSSMPRCRPANPCRVADDAARGPGLGSGRDAKR